MSITLKIDDDILKSIKLPAPELEEELKKELAFSLYSRWALPLGKARKMAEMSKREFLKELSNRKIIRHYTAQDLKDDLTYAKSRE